jgi:hypothetical protein
MKRGTFIFVFVLLLCAQGQRLLAAGKCSNRDFNGTYGIVAHGAVTVPGYPITGPFARAGQVTADGNGNLLFNTTASYNGYLFSEEIYATYAVASDCTMVFNVQPFAPIYQNATFKALFSDNKRRVDFMIADPPGQVISAVLQKQNSSACAERTLSGPYGLHLTGDVITAPAGLPSGKFVRVGSFTPDGTGHFSAQTNTNYNGFVIREEDFSGTYTVAGNCTVNIQYTYENVTYLWTGAIVDNGQGVDLVVANIGFAIAGELNQQ